MIREHLQGISKAAWMIWLSSHGEHAEKSAVKRPSSIIPERRRKVFCEAGILMLHDAR
jgi:hypothetical protein